MNFREDERGLAVGLLLFFAALTIGALLFALFNPMMTSVDDRVSDQTDDPDAQSVIDERMQIWGGLLFYVMFLSGIYILAKSVFESRGR